MLNRMFPAVSSCAGVSKLMRLPLIQRKKSHLLDDLSVLKVYRSVGHRRKFFGNGNATTEEG